MPCARVAPNAQPSAGALLNSVSDIFDFTAEAAHFATLVRALCGRPEARRRPGHTIGMVGKAQEVPGSARNGLVLRESV